MMSKIREVMDFSNYNKIFRKEDKMDTTKFSELIGGDRFYCYPEFIRKEISENDNLIFLKATNYNLSILITKSQLEKIMEKQ